MPTSSRGISVVIASIVGPPFIDACLESVADQARDSGAEVIVVACGPAEYADRIARLFPWVTVISQPTRETVPALRLRGVQKARGDVVAIIEEHCLAAPDWLKRVAAANADGADCVSGGPVAHHNYNRLRDWVVYFCEYNNYFPPWKEGDWHDLGSANIAYSRSLLLKYESLLSGGYWEAALHPRLAADGVPFRAIPSMVVYHRGPFNFGYYLQQRFWFSRAFAGARILPASRKAIYVVMAPLVPFLLLARMARRVWSKRCRPGKFVQCVPLLIPALIVFVSGEFVGYLFGPGEALLKVE